MNFNIYVEQIGKYIPTDDPKMGTGEWEQYRAGFESTTLDLPVRLIEEDRMNLQQQLVLRLRAQRNFKRLLHIRDRNFAS